MGSFFSTDGPIISFMTKVGEIIIVTVLTLIFMIPVITIVPALSAMYYAMIKSVRRERGYVHKEFFRSFKHGFFKGILLSIIYEGLTGLILYNLNIVNEENITFILIYIISLAIILMSLVYIIPILSRFDMKLTEMIKLSIVMAIRHFHITLLLTGGVVILVYLQLVFLRVPLILIVPGIWCYISTFLMEKVLKKYMNQATDENVDKWYLE